MQLVVLALVAAAYAEPEAEANAEAEPWWYSNYGYASPYYSGYRYGYSPYYNWGGYRYLWKRDAEAEAQPKASVCPALHAGGPHAATGPCTGLDGTKPWRMHLPGLTRSGG